MDDDDFNIFLTKISQTYLFLKDQEELEIHPEISPGSGRSQIIRDLR